MGEMRVMGIEGDVKTIWDPHNADEVAAARKSFDELRKKGYLAFRVDDETAKKGSQITSFDPNAGKLIMAPPMAGG